MNWFKNLRIATKLILGFFVVAIIAAVVGILGIRNISVMNEKSSDLFNKNTLGIAYSGDAASNFERLRYHGVKLTIMQGGDEEEECIAAIEEICTTIDGLLLKYKSTIETEEQLSFYEELRTEWEKYKGYMQEAISYAQAGQDAKADQIILIESNEIGSKMRGEFITLMKNSAADADQTAQNNNHLAQRSSLIMIIVIIFGVILSITLGLYIARVISKPIRQMVMAADTIALGDVNVNIEASSRDEVGSLAISFQKMIHNIRNQALSAEKIAEGDLTVEVPISSSNDLLGKKLSEIVKKNFEVLSSIFASSDQVAVGSKQVSDASIHLSEGATEQSSAIQELTASIEEISSQTELNANNANQANELAEEAKSNAKQGNSQMKEMLKAMDEINESSTNISKVIKVIDDIAFQTNILALNAAVEAARAGQHGKGFAVVAEEVRNLAARSAKAAKETTEMIEGSIKKSEGGTKIAKDTAQALDKIVNGIEQVATLVSGIASASNEQAIGIKQINQGIMQVSQVVQSNSTTAEEIAAASEELSSQAILLKETVNQFKLNKNANGSNKYQKINPQVLKMLENMSAMGSNGMGQPSDSYEEAETSISKISLSDVEFGKY